MPGIDKRLAQRFSSKSSRSRQGRYTGRLPIDTRLVERMLLSPDNLDPNPQVIEMQEYLVVSRLPYNERGVYAAIKDGLTDPEAIKMATGFNTTTVTTAVQSLEDRGIIPKGLVAIKLEEAP